MGLFESYDSTKDITKKNQVKKITITIITTIIVHTITKFQFSILNEPNDTMTGTHQPSQTLVRHLLHVGLFANDIALVVVG